MSLKRWLGYVAFAIAYLFIASLAVMAQHDARPVHGENRQLQSDLDRSDPVRPGFGNRR